MITAKTVRVFVHGVLVAEIRPMDRSKYELVPRGDFDMKVAARGEEAHFEEMND